MFGNSCPPILWSLRSNVLARATAIKVQLVISQPFQFSTVFQKKAGFRLFSLSKINMTNREAVGFYRADAVSIFNAALESVMPQKMIANHLKFSSSKCLLTVQNQSYVVNNNVYVVGFGKAVCGMAAAVEGILCKHIVKGVISIPMGMRESLILAGKQDQIPKNPKIQIVEGAQDNLPDCHAQTAAMEIYHLASSLQEQNILIVLISGGGSALLPAPCLPITLEEELQLTRFLSKHGCSINQLNTVRQNIEVLKGGGLAMVAQPSQVIGLILSDVIGDSLDMIASGPTACTSSTPQDCLNLFQSLDMSDKVPRSVITFLKMKAEKRKQEEQKGLPLITAHNVIVGSNQIATSAASEIATDIGYDTLVLTTTLDGEAKQVGAAFVILAEFICLSYLNDQSCVATETPTLLSFYDYFSLDSITELRSVIRTAASKHNGICVICGGETTVSVSGTGKGGRNQEMALAVAIQMKKSSTIQKFKETFLIEFLSAGTDGQDGPTEAAGAIVNPVLIDVAQSVGINAESHLENNDSNTFFSSVVQGQSLVNTGFTGTNVMDIQILLVSPLLL